MAATAADVVGDDGGGDGAVCFDDEGDLDDAGDVLLDGLEGIVNLGDDVLDECFGAAGELGGVGDVGGRWGLEVVGGGDKARHGGRCGGG